MHACGGAQREESKVGMPYPAPPHDVDVACFAVMDKSQKSTLPIQPSMPAESVLLRRRGPFKRSRTGCRLSCRAAHPRRNMQAVRG